MSRRARPRKSLVQSAAAIVVIGLLGALGVRCRLDKILEHGGLTKDGDFRPTATSAARHPPSKREPTSGRTEPSSPTGATPAPGGSATEGTPPARSSGSVHLALGTPTDADPSDDLLLVKAQYALSYNPRRNVPNWVSQNLDESYFGPAPRHKGKFLADETLPAGVYRVRDQDYTGSGYDRGHMVRSEERTRTPEDNTATFLLTNVLPQRHDLNAGPWLRLEDYCQELSQKSHRELYIMTGGIFAPGGATIGHGVAVPTECFKIVVVLERGRGARDVTEGTRVIAVVMPNVTGILDEGWGRYRTTVREIERRTGYDFLSAVPAVIQRLIETRTDDGPTSGH